VGSFERIVGMCPPLVLVVVGSERTLGMERTEVDKEMGEIL